MLQVRNLHAYYGKSHVLQGVDFSIGDNEIVSILGRNGVGRSTTLKTIMGNPVPQGDIRFKMRAIAGLKPYEIARLGIGYVPEERAIFPSLTVAQNLLLGVKPGKTPKRWGLEETWRVFPRLQERADAPGGALSGGEQQMLTIEQRLVIALRISHRVYVMGHGRMMFEGTPAALLANADVRREWLEV
jgi:branched-chain amino acid transport system ATP-binding protein